MRENHYSSCALTLISVLLFQAKPFTVANWAPLTLQTEPLYSYKLTHFTVESPFVDSSWALLQFKL